MKTYITKIIGWSLLLFGVLITIFSEQIVFPGLESMIGIETIVGHDNVVYRPDGSYYYTNPAAIIRWVLLVRIVGILICLFGGWLLFRTSNKQEV